MLLDPIGFSSSGAVPPLAAFDPAAARVAFAALAAVVAGGLAIIASAARRAPTRWPPTARPEPPGGRPSPVVPAVARGLAGFHDFLTERDGTPDLRRATLSRREELFDRLERAPLRSRRRIDRDVFL